MRHCIKHEVLIEDAVIFYTLLRGRGRGGETVNTSIFGSVYVHGSSLAVALFVIQETLLNYDLFTPFYKW